MVGILFALYAPAEIQSPDYHHWGIVHVRVNVLSTSSSACAYYSKSIFSVLSNSRMMYAFARDGGFPGHKFFHYVHPKTQVPVRTGESKTGHSVQLFTTYLCVVWLACTLSFILGLPSLASSVAFTAATSITTIGLYISYGV
jgi:amino acid transporter